MMRKSLLATGIMTLVGFYTGAASAGSVAIPKTFVAGTKAVADDVNANFTAVKTAVDDNDTRVTANTAATQLNTTHRTGDGSDHAAVAANTAAIQLNTTHRTGDGSDHAAVATNTAAISQLQNPTGAPCQGNDINDVMVRVGPLCVDRYEASVWNTAAGGGTQYGAVADDYPCANNANDCTGGITIYARSEAGRTPSTNITWYQAQQACAASGKRLLTNAEWQMAAAGTPDPGPVDDGATQCRVSTGNGLTGSRSLCVSNWGANDMAGNVWEWVADWIHGNGTTGTWAPAAGGAGSDYGADIVSGANPAQNTGVNASNQPAAIFRGGRGIAGANAGIFAFVAKDSPANSDPDVGFRCAR